MLDEMASVPGVSAAGAAGTLPVAATSMTGPSFEIRSRVRSDSAPPLFSMYTAVTAGYFETLAAPLLEGRAPIRSDADQELPVAWVNQAFARQFLKGRALGERISIAERPWLEVVGVVGDLRTSGLGDEVRPMIYVPLSNPAVTLDVMYAVVRTKNDPASLAPALRAAIDRVDASVPLVMRTMDDIVSASMAQTTFTLTLLAMAAGIGLVLGVVGLYGAVSYIASQRTAAKGGCHRPRAGPAQRRLNPRRVGGRLSSHCPSRAQNRPYNQGHQSRVVTRIGGANGAETVEQPRFAPGS